MKYVKTVLASLAVLSLALSCQGPTADVPGANPGLTVDISVDAGTAGGSRALPGSTAKVQLRVVNAAGTEVFNQTDSSAPFTFSVTGLTAGNHVFAARAKDSGDAALGGSAQTVNVTASTSLTMGVAAFPSITVDGTIDGGYGAVYGTGDGAGWGAEIDDVYVTNDKDNLYVTLDFDPVDAGNNIWLFLDDASQTNGEGSFTGDVYASYGSLNLTNPNSVNVDYALAGYRSGAAYVIERERSILNAGTGSFTNRDTAKTVVLGENTTNGVYELKIPLSSIGGGTSLGNTVRIYALFGKDDSNGGIHSAYPTQSGANLDNAANKLTSLATADSGYIIK